MKSPIPQFITQNINKYEILQKKTPLYIDIKRSIEKDSITWSWTLPFSRGRGVNSIGLPWDLNCEELCDLFCLAFLTDFRENPSTLSTDGGVVGAEDISLLKRKRYHKHIPKAEAQERDPTPQKRDHLLEGRPLVVQALPARWVF